MIKKFLWTLSLLLLTGVALAVGTSGTETNPVISADAVSQHTDLSLAYLSQIFGTVGHILQGTSGQMLGQLFYRLNQGVLVVAGLFLGYTVFIMVVRSAMEGSASGPNRNTALIFLRVALGISLLVPSSDTGYSLLQGIVMKVVIEGVKLADSTWSYGLDYIDQGGAVWQRPEEVGVETPLAGNELSEATMDKMLSTMIGPIFRNEICMVLYQFKRGDNANIGNPLDAASSQGNAGAIVNMGGFPAQSYVKSVTNKKGEVTSYQFPAGKKGDDRCGKVKWSSPAGGKDAAKSALMAKAVKRVIDSLLPVARRYACYVAMINKKIARRTGKLPPSCLGNFSTLPDQAADTFFSTMANYVDAMQPVQTADKPEGDSARAGFVKTAKEDGWIVAGRYYWDLSQVDASGAKNAGIAMPQVTDHTQTPSGRMNKLKVTKEMVPIVPTDDIDSDNDPVIYDKIKKKITVYSTSTSAAKKGDTGGRGGASSNAKIIAVLIGAIAMMSPAILPLGLIPIITDIVSLINLFTPHAMGPDPILFLHRLGLYCIGISTGIFLGTGLIVFGMMFLTVVCQGMFNLATPIKEAMSWLRPPLLLVAVAFLTTGIMMGYFVPLYPYMIYTFTVISWFITVIEAMVAAPLIAFGMTHPEGHDLMGEAKQATMLLLSVFLRPTLTVIGLISGMILSYVSLRFLLYTYSGLLSDLFSQGSMGVSHSSATGNIAAGAGSVMANLMGDSLDNASLMGILGNLLFSFPFFLIMFASIVYAVVKQCFSLIYVLPDYIMRWIGGPVQPTGMSPAQMAQEVSGAAKQYADTAGGSTKSAIESANRGSEGGEESMDADVSGGGDSGGDSGGKGGGGGGAGAS